MMKPSEAVRRRVPAAATLNGKAMTAANAAMMAGGGNESMTIVRRVRRPSCHHTTKLTMGRTGPGRTAHCARSERGTAAALLRAVDTHFLRHIHQFGRAEAHPC